MHIYKKRDFSNGDSMGRRIQIALCNQLHLTTIRIPDNQALAGRIMASMSWLRRFLRWEKLAENCAPTPATQLVAMGNQL
jgi:hypothetical protein